MRAHLVLGSLAISLLACVTSCVQETRAPMMQRTSDDGAVPPSARQNDGVPPSKRAALEQIVLESRGPWIEDDVCSSALLYFSINRDQGLHRLDDLLAWSERNPPQDRQSAHCFFLTARLRALLLWRTRRLDLDRELAHRHPLVRAATIGLLAIAHADAPRIRKALGDPSAPVRNAALEAVTRAHDVDALPIIERMFAKPEMDEGERRRACIALAAFGRPSSCTAEESAPFRRDVPDPAPDAHCPKPDAVADTDRERRTRVFLVWYSDHITPISSPLDLLFSVAGDRAAIEACPKDIRLIEELVLQKERDALVATAAALLLTEKHPPTPRTPEELRRGLVEKTSKPKTF